MGKISIHLENNIHIPFQGIAETGNVGRAQPHLFWTLQKVDTGIVRLKTSHGVGSAIRRAVVNNKHLKL